MAKNTFEEKVNLFIKKLSRYENKTGIYFFNPWKDQDKDNDLENAPQIRCENLKNYLLDRHNAKYILIGEAPSYQGCKFSGIPFMSERILLGEHSKVKFINKDNSYKRTSNGEKKKGKTYTENSATMVWSKMNELLDEKDWVAWNVFPFHPPKIGNSLSNRTPSDDEIKKIKEILEEFLKLFDNSKIIPVGKKSYYGLGISGIVNEKPVSHPANGRRKEFDKGIEEIINTDKAKNEH